MKNSPHTIGDLIKYMDSDEFKKLLSPNQINLIKDALKARWTFDKASTKI